MTRRGRDANIYDDAIAFIQKNHDRPFYVNVWGHITHFPVNPPQTYADRFKDLTVKESDFSEPMRQKLEGVRKEGGDVNECMRRYLGDLLSLDDSVGRLLTAIDDLGLRDDTIVVFSSDQGARTSSPPETTPRIGTPGGGTCWDTTANSAAVSIPSMREACGRRSSSAGPAMFPRTGSTRPP